MLRPTSGKPESTPDPAIGGGGQLSGAWIFLPCLALASVAAFVANRRPTPGPVEQPIAFNHKLHVEDQGMECSSCHPGYARSPRPGLPTAKACSLCHSEALGESAEERRLVELIGGNAELLWQPLFRQPPHVFFSHARHVTVSGIECVRCHGEIAQSTRPPSHVRPLRMDDCIACHEQHGASVGCSACHR